MLGVGAWYLRGALRARVSAPFTPPTIVAPTAFGGGERRNLVDLLADPDAVRQPLADT